MKRHFEPLDITSLNDVLTRAKHFPSTSDDLAQTARESGADPTVINFFESMPAGTLVPSKTDLMRRSFEVDVLMEEAQSQPEENPPII